MVLVKMDQKIQKNAFFYVQIKSVQLIYIDTLKSIKAPPNKQGPPIKTGPLVKQVPPIKQGGPV